MGPQFFGSQTGQRWAQILGREHHRYARIAVSWSGVVDENDDPRWEVPPPVEYKRPIEVR